MRIASIVGARPQFIKVKPLIDELKKEKCKHILIHTGQHYDYEMSKIFFDELDIPKPDYNLEIGSHSHGKQTGLMLEKIEEILIKEKPHIVIVYGDTNSTLAGALAAGKLNIPVAHVEAGLRSYRLDMPEEINRVLTDHISKFLFCPTKTAINNLRKEGITKGVFWVGDVMYDIFKLKIKNLSLKILSKLNLKPKKYFLLTIHRQENTDNLKNLKAIISALVTTKEKIVFPIHPRTEKALTKIKGLNFPNFLFINPVSYLDMLELEKNAKKILTDSGGVQKEAYWLKVPCITLRNETEWVETLQRGWNLLAGTDKVKIAKFIKNSITPHTYQNVFKKGNTSEKIVKILLNS
jgi:UDP-N-acetylglucosamine 2-epimerase